MKDFFSEEGESVLDRSTSDMTIKVRKDCVKVIGKVAQSCLTLCDPMDYTVRGSAGKESACNVGVLGSISGLGRSPGDGTIV